MLILIIFYKIRQETIERLAVIKIQRIARIYICRERNKKRHQAINKIQGYFKMKWLSFLFQMLRTNVKMIQVNDRINIKI